jgi:hypothetical protein
VTGVLTYASTAAELFASFTHTPKYTVPTAAPVLFQLYVLLVEYPWTSCQLLCDAGLIQNSYSGFASVQPAPTAVIVT